MKQVLAAAVLLLAFASSAGAQAARVPTETLLLRRYAATAHTVILEVITLAADGTYLDRADGTLTIRDGATVVATMPAPVSGARIELHDVAYGQHQYIATYSGDENLLPSSSTVLATRVTPLPVLFLLDRASIAGTVGQELTITARFTDVADATGVVTWTVGRRVVAVTPVVNGAATLLYTPDKWMRSTLLIADYSGDDRYGPTWAAGSLSIDSDAATPDARATARQDAATGRWDVDIELAPMPGVTHYQLYVDDNPELSIGTELLFDAAPNHVYVIRGKAHGEYGALSDFGTPDIATTVAFTADRHATLASALASPLDVLELQHAIDLVRAAAGLAPASFTPPGALVTTDDLLALRTALSEAFAVFGIPLTFRELSPRGHVRAAQLRELRDALR
ncbi:MAG TPA: Ig-like domain-containing protein [Thermoanaerobaculia bacterium]|nr:Ig-like domain-containing protein [Thermoanaerobaculia bacterium]